MIVLLIILNLLHIQIKARESSCLVEMFETPSQTVFSIMQYHYYGVTIIKILRSNWDKSL